MQTYLQVQIKESLTYLSSSKKSKDTKASSATKVVEKTSSSKKDDVSDKQLLKRAKKLKYGMSYDEVKKNHGY